MQVDCLPIRVIPRVESSPIGVELVREDKIPLLVGIRERRLSVRALRCSSINKTNVVRDLGNLASSICATQVERALCCLESSGEMTVDRVTSTRLKGLDENGHVMVEQKGRANKSIIIPCCKDEETAEIGNAA
jgi:hypothetical protein